MIHIQLTVNQPRLHVNRTYQKIHGKLAKTRIKLRNDYAVHGNYDPNTNPYSGDRFSLAITIEKQIFNQYPPNEPNK